MLLAFQKAFLNITQIYLCVCGGGEEAWMCLLHGACVQVREQPSTKWWPGSGSRHQPWQQAPYPLSRLASPLRIDIIILGVD